MTTDAPTAIDRRTYLASLAGIGTAALAGCTFLESGQDGSTTRLEDAEARALAERFAPSFYFDTYEKWFPTDPRHYEIEADGESVVGGFEAFNGYHERFDDPDSPPDPTVFYHAVEYDDSPLAVVQFWQYSAFDQFSTNFHWHDWEVLHVFVDTDSNEPQLHVASSHSRRVPNNEFLDPDPDRIPAILVELGSHSNTLSINEQRERFQRLPRGGVLADITNGAFDGLEALADMPIAYGLPRDEGGPLPFALPELDGVPIYEHDRLPSVDRTDLLEESLVIRSYEALASPPSDLPLRETGMVFDHVDRNAPDADVEYDLAPARELEHIEEFTGPQLSFEFAVPQFLEDAVSGHITSVGVPWHSPRYDNPAADISDPDHRGALAERYEAIGEPSPVNTVVASVTEAITTDDAPEDEGLTTEDSTVESVVLLESEPEVVPTFAGGVTVFRGVPDGDHRLTVNGAGVAPHSEEVSPREDEEITAAGVNGEVPLVANEHAIKLEVDPTDADSELTDLAIEDDFAGRLYDAPLSEPDAVYVHRGGAYTTEIRDSDDEIGAIRVNPGRESERVRVEDPRTGKASLATFLATIAEETAASVASVATDETTDDQQERNTISGLQQALAAVADSAQRAADQAEAGNRENADAALDEVSTRLDRVAERLTDARQPLPDEIARAVERRLEQARRRTEQAKRSEKL
ncbi:hypothetical protein AArcSl_0733 [Halalkaliarchaeum desulfuricum]|uniref:Uncharacterized protein n=1 Tax=Halalkaliarchaeum desulfuricum TaxID=2055893 RepID=A0A343TH08_9EURY|nr:hypothetical protein [Halalkaliarchaeum desulfuricum]AUX08380.1 hypothetical protein AArcSl_0733 [Halalkaliarchaeum desulfuricum]